MGHHFSRRDLLKAGGGALAAAAIGPHLGLHGAIGQMPSAAARSPCGCGIRRTSIRT
jgi:TAT (twin-arginine translocation) pathway signal sequence.